LKDKVNYYEWTQTKEKFKKIHPEGHKLFAIKKKIAKVERQIATLKKTLEQLKIKESKMK